MQYECEFKWRGHCRTCPAKHTTQLYNIKDYRGCWTYMVFSAGAIPSCFTACNGDKLKVEGLSGLQ